jgi:hypothetical protein
MPLSRSTLLKRGTTVGAPQKMCAILRRLVLSYWAQNSTKAWALPVAVLSNTRER